MATVLMLLALLPAIYGVMITGDFSQYAYKPTRKQVYFVLRKRLYLISAGILLWLAGFVLHLLFTPINAWFLIISGILLLLFITAGFLMPGYILFRALHQPHWISVTEANDYLSSDESVIGIEINGDARAYPVHDLIPLD